MKTIKADYEAANESALARFNELGIECHISQPLPDVSDDWPNILFNVTFSRNAQSVTVEYRMGVGHVKWPTRFEEIPHFAPANMIPVFNTIRTNPGAQLKNKAEHAEAAAFLAKAQKVSPKPYEVFAAICDDALSAHNDSFDGWASNLGLNSDSIKDKAVYEYCCELYHKVARLVDSKTIQQFAELHSQF